ncbi:MAG: hypothetical protein WD965_02995 [Actinomycetota bacterium]
MAGRPWIRAGWADAIARGFLAFLAVTAIGQMLAFLTWFVADTGASSAAAVRLGWMYFGAFHHVAIEIDVSDLDLVAPGTAPGSTSLSIGVALLSVTAVAVLLLVRAGHRVADRAGGSAGARVLLGAAVAPSYALAAFVTALLVEVTTPLRFGSFATGELSVTLSPWQALVFPFAIAAVSGAAGGFRSALGSDALSEDVRRIAAASAGALRMLVAGLGLSLAGLFVAGVVQPDEPVALLTPSTARYFETVFDRPATGLAILGHHLAVAPNEAVWTLVPAMGACDGVRGSASRDLLCYSRFPTLLETTGPGLEGVAVSSPFGPVIFSRAPAEYLAFLLVPVAATVLGGRLAGGRFGGSRRERTLVGVTAGAMFALLIGVGAVLSSITIAYGAAFGGDGSAGWIVLGPNVVTGTLCALAWGCAGGALGAATSDRPLRSRA